MKHVSEVVACVCDYGTFGSVAEKLAETMERVYYWTPIDIEYQDVRDVVQGEGMRRVTRIDSPFDYTDVDLYVFPDIGMSGLQCHFQEMGKAVWGHMGATELELYRDHFLHTLQSVGLPTIPSVKIRGLSRLRAYLRDKRNKWVKVNQFRANMETWKWRDAATSSHTLDSLAVIFGGYAERVTFVVQDDLPTDVETGYDGWCVDGVFPPSSFQGYEKKNELYLGSVLDYDALGEEIREVNDRMAPVLRDYGYRCWWATEIRVSDGVPYFIDPTPRMPGQTGEHQLESIYNFAEIIWEGANGNIVTPNYNYTFAAEATLHYKTDTKDPTISDEWKSLRVPDGVRPWTKLYHYCVVDGVAHFAARNTDEIGVVIGLGDSAEEAINHLKENLDAFDGLPVDADTSGFADLIDAIKHAEEEGIPFGGRLPKKTIALD